jgi:phosphoribosylglycinamide formyltransferase-1
MQKTPFGIWTTGRDEAALQLLQAIYQAVIHEVIPGTISYVFCNRVHGEGTWSDKLLAYCDENRLHRVAVSSAQFELDLKKRDLERWRRRFHGEVRGELSAFREKFRVLAGYMLILDPETCWDVPTMNLHPAKPGGPKGTWQEVIWQLIEDDADETGVMMHLVTPELDEGPPIAYCTFPIKGNVFDPLWKDLKQRLRGSTLSSIVKGQGENNPLFKEIRKHGLVREFPLIVHTIREVASGNLQIVDGRVRTSDGKSLTEGYCLTEAIDQLIGETSHTNVKIK